MDEGNTAVAPRSPGKLARRLITIPGYVVACTLALGLLPWIAIIALLTDVIRGRRFATIRCVGAVIVYLLCECLGIVASAFLWAFCPRDRYASANYALQRMWASSLFASLRWIFGMRYSVEGAELLDRGPIVMMVRHTSTADTVVPATLLGSHGLHPRYVLKRELLADPCLDIVGNRVPNAFVRRDGDPAATASVRALIDSAAEGDAVVIYPEGTRFTQSARMRALERLADSPRLAAATALRHLLPIRLGGALALLESETKADVIFCAHVGFEGAATLADLANGKLVGRALHVKLWRVPAAEVPARGRDVWLDEWWSRVDAWIEGQEREPPPAVVLFDGVCNLCSHSVQFILGRDSRQRFRFASLQSEAGKGLLAALGHTPIGDTPESIVLVDGDRLWERSDAALRIAAALRFPWNLLGILWVVPRPLRDAVYRFIAHHRYRWFGRTESCMVPTPEIKARFLP